MARKGTKPHGCSEYLAILFVLLAFRRPGNETSGREVRSWIGAFVVGPGVRIETLDPTTNAKSNDMGRGRSKLSTNLRTHRAFENNAKNLCLNSVRLRLSRTFSRKKKTREVSATLAWFGSGKGEHFANISCFPYL